ncbi:hypothetical protein AWM70_03820 [Paenibacillus yonginensis]|uniref:Uncharacterized protein n=1 Tax=Paenibacillus yonginensis TaxID=1462996 RepID=A0A1B1MXB1_9BACL|nr:hypothetical protein [Paenibacillus yonginensis]ANS73808.1 hypothetical protein AWM70_03820 [Paenibacillus yonginensis]
MKPETNLSLWMTEFLCSSDQVKLRRIREAESLHNPELMNSIYFHLAMRDKLHLLENRKIG